MGEGGVDVGWSTYRLQELHTKTSIKSLKFYSQNISL